MDINTSTSECSTRRSVSVLIVSKDRREALTRLARQLTEQFSASIDQVVVVEETDHPHPIQNTTYIPHPVAHRGIPFARNLALAHAHGDIIVFVDDDCRLTDGWLENLIEPIQRDDTILGTQGGVTVPGTSNAIGWAESLLGVPGRGITRVLKAGGRVRPTREISTLNCAYRRKVVDHIGGFEKQLRITGEDYLLAKQVCLYGTCVFVPDALVYHEPRGTLGQIWTWFIRRGRAEVDVIRTGKQKDITGWTVLRSSLLIKLLLVGLAGAFLPYGAVMAALAICVVYPAIQYVRYFRWWRGSPAPPGALIVLPFLKFVMDVAMDMGRVRGALFDR